MGTVAYRAEPRVDGYIAAQHDTLNEPALLRMVEQIIANSRAGGWRRLKT